MKLKKFSYSQEIAFLFLTLFLCFLFLWKTPAFADPLKRFEEKGVGELGLEMKLQMLSNTWHVDWSSFNSLPKISNEGTFNFILDGKRTYQKRLAPITTYSPHSPIQFGALKATVAFHDFRPYTGIGWGNPLSPDNQWNMVLGLGIVKQGPAELELDLTRSHSWNPELVNEGTQFVGLGQVEYFPMVTFGFMYKF